MLLVAHHATPEICTPPHRLSPRHATPSQASMPADRASFLSDIDHSFRGPLRAANLRDVARRLQSQFREKLQRSDLCMLPSYNDVLPTGDESGEFLAADLGGSTFRLARVRLTGKHTPGQAGAQILRQHDFCVDESVRALVGTAFFDWMAGRIRQFLILEAPHSPATHANDHPLPIEIGLSWSFPVDHMSRRSAGLLPMGKLFHAADGLRGHDLGALVEEACQRQGMHLTVSGIVNDSAASLLAQIYANDSTSMAVILGTGLNAAIQLPSTAFSPLKLSPYPTPGNSRRGSTCQNVLVNTELSMFGKDALATTQWDEVLNMMHPNPDFQPLEHFTSGRYLGEIVRLVILEAVERVALFAGETPAGLAPYELQVLTLAAIESDTSSSLHAAKRVLKEAHPLPSGADYATADVAFLRHIITSVSDRAAAYLATAIYALWALKNASDRSAGDLSSVAPETTSISCLGSILAKYPNYLSRVQTWLDLLTQEDAGASIDLVLTDEHEGPLVGAAVACSMGER